MRPKPPKLYTSEIPPAQPPSRSHSVKPDTFRISERMEELRTLSKEITAATSKVEHWIRALTHLSQAVHDRGALQDVISALSQMKRSGSAGNSKPGSSGSGSASQGNNPPHPQGPHSKDGDSLYDIINSPNFTKIVEKVMEKKRKGQRKKSK